MDATFGGDFLHRLGCQLKQANATVNALFVDEFRQGVAVFPAEKVGKVAGVDIQFLGNGFQAQVSGQIVLDQCDSLTDIEGIFV